MSSTRSLPTSTTDDLDALLTIALDAVEAGSRIALDPPADLGIDTKSNRNDLVTAVDRAVENHIAEILTRRTGLPLLGEESHGVDSFAGRVWVLDPIDGTMNYVETHRDWAISLALVEDGVPVLGVVADPTASRTWVAVRGRGAHLLSPDGTRRPLTPVDPTKGLDESIVITDVKEIDAMPRLDRAIRASRGHRRYGSAALEIVEVAASRAGAFVHMWVSPWDVAAATLVATEAGVTVTRLDGTPLDVRFKGSILAATPAVHTELLDRLMIRPE